MIIIENQTEEAFKNKNPLEFYSKRVFIIGSFLN